MKEIVEVRKSLYNGKYDKVITIEYKYLVPRWMVHKWKVNYPRYRELLNKGEWKVVYNYVITEGFCRYTVIPSINSSDEMSDWLDNINNEAYFYNFITNLKFGSNHVTTKNVQTLSGNSLDDMAAKIDDYLSKNTSLECTVVMKKAEPYGEVGVIYQKKPKHECRLEIARVSFRISDEFAGQLGDALKMFPDMKWSPRIVGWANKTGKFIGGAFFADGTIAECECLRMVLSDFSPKPKLIKQSK